MRLRLAKHSVPEDSSRDPGRGEGRRCRCVLVCTHQSFARRSVSQSCERLCSLGCVHCQRRLSLPFHCLSLKEGKGGFFRRDAQPCPPLLLCVHSTLRGVSLVGRGFEGGVAAHLLEVDRLLEIVHVRGRTHRPGQVAGEDVLAAVLQTKRKKTRDSP